LKKRDELYESAVDLVVREQRGSVSLLQRALGIGYGRAARLIDFMAEDGIVGQYNGRPANFGDEKPVTPAAKKNRVVTMVHEEKEEELVDEDELAEDDSLEMNGEEDADAFAEGDEEDGEFAEHEEEETGEEEEIADDEDDAPHFREKSA
jgi:S-DNA-T family DNA segregation ATPase FtsK/SpoIIIE